jgi:hypothetical protein
VPLDRERRLEVRHPALETEGNRLGSGRRLVPGGIMDPDHLRIPVELGYESPEEVVAQDAVDRAAQDRSLAGEVESDDPLAGKRNP